MLRFYFSGAPNPTKVALFLEEAGLAYEAIPVDTRKGEQHKLEYRAVNPNAKVPAIVDGASLCSIRTPSWSRRWWRHQPVEIEALRGWPTPIRRRCNPENPEGQGLSLTTLNLAKQLERHGWAVGREDHDPNSLVRRKVSASEMKRAPGPPTPHVTSAHSPAT